MSGLLVSCATQRHATIAWEGEKICVGVSPPGGSTLFSPPSIECLSCDEVLPPFPLDENAEGVAYLKLSEASSSVATRFRLRGAGLDTAVLLQPRPGAEATAYYRLPTPITGRILAMSLAHIYSDTTMSKSVGILERGAEANLFRENDVFYFIHHPMYDHPVVVLRSNAIRLR